MIRDDLNDTPLLIAVKNKQNEVVHALLCDHDCDPNVKDYYDRTPLHFACANGDINLVHELVRHKTDLSIRDKYDNTPILTAAVKKQYKVALSLISDFHCDPNVKGSRGRTLLHFACADGKTDLVDLLIKEYKADYNIKDDFNNTPHMTAAKTNQYEVLELLICSYGCDPNVMDSDNSTLLHFACANSNIDLVHVLLQNHKADLNIRNKSNDTPILTAAKYEQYKVLKSLLYEYGCDPNVKGSNGRTPLHFVCANGNTDLVHILVQECKADMNIRDDFHDTPVLVAAEAKHYKIVKLLCDYGCDPNIKGYIGRSLLHFLCADGNIDLIHVIVRDHEADLSIKDKFNNTPIIMACKRKQYHVVESLLREYACDPNMWCSCDHKALLHFACADGNISLLQLLIKDYKADLNATDKNGRSLLHVAQSVEVLKLLIKSFKLSPSVTDNDGNTPLHLFTYNRTIDCARALLFDFHAPVYLRNKAGQTPRDMNRSNEVKLLFAEYLSTYGKAVEADYKSMQLLAAKRYSGSNFVCRLFVVGHSGAGKSSLVETMKRDRFLESFTRVSKRSVPPHTAGIVPSVFVSKNKRIQFYDFAGDPEYYSSHAAILEKLFHYNIGSNICILVLNLAEEDNKIKHKYLYWFNFIRHNFRALRMPSVIVVGSHSDKLSDTETSRKSSYITQNLISKQSVYLPLDCCSPKGSSIKLLRQTIYEISKKSQPYCLSQEGRILLGLLEKDLKNVTACTAQTIASLAEEVNLSLPRSVMLLYPILQQLQAIGLLLIVGGRGEESQVVLNVAQLTNEVHEKLFSKDAFSLSRNLASFSIGLLPESLLQEILPKYITKECLIQLQYCQEISHIELGSDLSVSPIISSSTSLDKFLFFPALCSVDKKDISWLKLPDHSYTIGWLARCSHPHDFFTPRFLHVLLLRIALRFTLVAYSCAEVPSDCVHLRRSCKMWKSGVHWLTEKDMECEVDVKENKEIVVSIQSEENSKSCLIMLNNIINCVMQTKTEFCHLIRLNFFLINALNSLSDDDIYLLKSVERALQYNDCKVISVSGTQWMDKSKLIHLHSTFWDSLFPIDEHLVLKYIKTIAEEWYELGINLGLPSHILDKINHSKDVFRCKAKMVSTWLCSSSLHYPPCWWSLVKALKETRPGKMECAESIIKDKGKFIALQEKIFNSENSYLPPDEEFMELFASMVGSKWPYLASLLSLTNCMIEEIRMEGATLTERDRALKMLHKWVSKEEASYDQLYQILKPASLLSYC